MNSNTKYTGLLCIKCETCGHIHMFSSKYEKTVYYCIRCGSRISLDKPPVRLYINHECGCRRKYLTNMKDKLVDVECFKCKAPVTVEWNRKKQLYETVRE